MLGYNKLQLYYLRTNQPLQIINNPHLRVTVVVLGAYVCYHFNCYVPRLQIESKVPLVFS